jgi:hypothetical protein
MLTKQLMESLQTAAKSRQNVVYLNNSAANGDDYQIKPYETLIIVTNTGSYTQNLFLPHVGESVGVTITVLVPDVGGGGTLADRDDSQADWSDLTMDGDNEYAILHNTGRGWISIASDM